MSRKAKKRVAVLATSTSVTEKKEELEPITCIWYLITLKDQNEALLDSKNEVNIMSQAFANQLGLTIQKTNVRAQKIDDTTLEIYRIVVSTFSVSNKDGREKFFEESFLLGDVKLEIVPEYLS